MNTQTCLSDADLGRLWEDDVSPGQRESLEAHLGTCVQCKARWDEMAAGARQVDALLGTAPAEQPAGCLSEDLVAGYLDDALDPAEKRLVEDHLAQCERCRRETVLARQMSEEYEAEGDAWWRRFVGRQMLGLIARAPQEIDQFLRAAGIKSSHATSSQVVIKLPIMEPFQTAGMRLAAAAGDGFAEQVIRQDDPPFEFRLIQFGRQVNIIARAIGGDPSLNDCLARLELSEGGVHRLTRFVLIEGGEGHCVLEPADAVSVRPEKAPLGLQLSPIVSLEQLAAVGGEAYMPILRKLLKHADPAIRRATVEVLGRVGGSQAASIVKPLTDDADESVRSAAQKVLAQFPGMGE